MEKNLNILIIEKKEIKRKEEEDIIIEYEKR